MVSFVENEIKKLQLLCGEIYGEKVVVSPLIRIDIVGGTVLGKAVPPSKKDKKWALRFNLDYLTNNNDKIKKELIAHEYAHIITCEIYGKRCKPHGKEWKEVAKNLGAVPKASFTEKDTYIPPKKRILKKYPYKCGCSEHMLSSIRHNKAQNKTIYYCKKCKGKLELILTPL